MMRLYLYIRHIFIKIQINFQGKDFVNKISKNLNRILNSTLVGHVVSNPVATVDLDHQGLSRKGSFVQRLSKRTNSFQF